MQSHAVDLNNMYGHSNETNTSIAVLILFLFVLAASAKSAQLFLHNWLADAMQGPTPVSALLHAATLVVAGPILLAKLYMFTSYGVLGIQLLGMSTAMLGAAIAIGNTDSKTIIAYSTMSQFGYIISISTIWSSSVAYLHISTHACFKAALFMCAGVIIHSSYNMQDYRSFGAMTHIVPMYTQQFYFTGIGINQREIRIFSYCIHCDMAKLSDISYFSYALTHRCYHPRICPSYQL